MNINHFGIILLIFILTCFDSYLYSQKILTINLCDEMKKKEENNIFQLFIIINNDTLFIPKVGINKFFNPIEYYKIDSPYNKSDTSTYTIIIENSKFLYSVKVDTKDMYCENLKICIEHDKHKNIAQISYTNCESFGESMFTPVIRKQRPKKSCPLRGIFNAAA